MAGGLCLLVACGGGGGGGPSGAATEAIMTPTLTISYAKPAATVAPGDTVYLTPNYSAGGTAKITWISATDSGEISVSRPGEQKTDAPTSSTTYTLEVTYQDSTTVTPSAAPPIKSKPQPVTVTPIVTIELLKTVDLNTKRSDHASVTLPDGRILVSGGTDGTTILKSAEVFDPSTGIWTATGDMKTARRGHTMTVLQNYKVLVTGGAISDKAATPTAEVFDPSSGSWAATNKPMSFARRFHSATSLESDGSVLIAGGVVGPANGADPRVAEVYNPWTDTWSTTPPSLPEARQGHTATAISVSTDIDHILFLGNSGTSSADGKVLVSDKSKTGSARWAWLAGNYPTTSKRYNHTATVIPSSAGSTVYIIGGGDDPTTIEKMLFKASDSSWTASTGSLTTMNQTRSLHTSTKLLNNKILIVGDYDGTKSSTTLELYDPAFEKTQPVLQPEQLNFARSMHTSERMTNGDVLIIGTHYKSSGTPRTTTEIWRHCTPNTANTICTAK
jgi:hypothetical protein